MVLDCVIVGGGPAGLNAALVLGRARKHVIVFDENKPRNAVTRESHGFITRDGVEPGELKRLAYEDVGKYPSVQIKTECITEIRYEEPFFQLITEAGAAYESKKIILATGIKEQLPAIDGIRNYYGSSLFQCPLCDGWELRDQPLVVISESAHGFHAIKMLTNWSKDIVVCTNGHSVFSDEQKELLHARNIPVYEQKIKALSGQNGQLEQVVLEDGLSLARSGGIVSANWDRGKFGEMLGCELDEFGGIVVDELSRTSIKGVYAAGDVSHGTTKQVVIAAGEGSKAAIRVFSDLLEEEF